MPSKTAGFLSLATALLPLTAAADKIESDGDRIRFPYNGDGPYSGGHAIIGARARGALTIRDGGELDVDSASFGYFAGGSGHLAIDGSGSNLTSRGAFTLAQSGTGSLLVSNGGHLVSLAGIVGYAGRATARIQGPGSRWEIGDFGAVGLYSHSELSVERGAIVQVGGNFETGGGSLGRGEVTVRDKATELAVNGTFHLGVFGVATLQLLDGGVAKVSGLSLGTRGGNGRIWMADGTLAWKGDRRNELAALRAATLLYNGENWEPAGERFTATYVAASPDLPPVSPQDFADFEGYTLFRGGVSTVRLSAKLPPPTGGLTVSRQTGLFEITVPVRNLSANAVNGFRLHADIGPYLAETPDLRLANATDPAGGGSYVEHAHPVGGGAEVWVTLVFQTGTRELPQPFQPALEVEALSESQPANAEGKGVHPKMLPLGDGALLLEFPSVAGRWYRVRYSPDLIQWRESATPVRAGSNRARWIDRGPPFTDIHPRSAPTRYYLVEEIIGM